MAPIAAGIPDYDRGDWRHWIDEDGDCQDARQESVVAESLVSVTYLCHLKAGDPDNMLHMPIEMTPD